MFSCFFDIMTAYSVRLTTFPTYLFTLDGPFLSVVLYNFEIRG